MTGGGNRGNQGGGKRKGGGGGKGRQLGGKGEKNGKRNGRKFGGGGGKKDIGNEIIENPTFVKCKSGELGCLQVDNNLGGKLLIEGVQKALKVWPEDEYFLPEVGMDDPKVGPPKSKKTKNRRDQRSANAGAPAAPENVCNE